jgi:mRNA interferase RelE/StbE
VRILNQIDGELSKKADSCPVLKGQFAGLRKYRIGDYRVIYSILDEDILILRIGHRRDVYKKKI